MNTTDKKFEFEGKCAFAVSLGKSDVVGGNYQLEKNGKCYKFSNPIAKLLFNILPSSLKKAETNWNKMSSL